MKIIVCPCAKRKFRYLGIAFVYQRTFGCSCVNALSEFLVFPCAVHTMFKPLFGGFVFKFDCRCHQLSLMEYCQNCFNIRYSLNFVADKICLGQQQLPDEMKEKPIKIETFLEKIPNELFFHFSKNEQKFI